MAAGAIFGAVTELGVYIHFPFCGSRCGYCDFYSTVEPVPDRLYADAILRELDHRAASFAAWRLGSIYLGGGTPSLWHPDQVCRVLQAVVTTFGATDPIEVTLELNPGSGADPQRLLVAGVNRLSVGLQSMDDQVLQTLGRRHRVEQATQAVERARRAGFDNISCDLIFGLPGQTPQNHLDQIARLLRLRPDHVSTYALSLSHDSVLHRRGIRPAAPDLVGEMMEGGRTLLASEGYEQYEVSNHARPGRRSRHNCGVWASGPYLGLGAGAHSMRPDGRANVRTANPPLKEYLAGVAAILPGGVVTGAEVEQVENGRARFEMVMLGLRTRDGVDREAYRRRFGVDVVHELGPRLDELTGQGLVAVDPGRLKPTDRGILFADELALRLMD